MKSISFAKGEVDKTLMCEIWSTIQRYRGCFYKEKSCRDAEELMMLVFHHMLDHYKPENGSLVGYMLKLISSMSKSRGKETSCDFLEDTLSDELDKQAAASGNSSDLVTKVIESLDTDEEKFTAVAELALGNMTFFNLMCESLINRVTTTRYFPDSFIHSSLALVRRCGGENFNRMCLYIYRKYKAKFNQFMAGGLDETSSWRELDGGLIAKNTSKRVLLINKGTKEVCKDPDIEDWEVKGQLKGKRIIKVPYQDLYKRVIDMLEDDNINPLKFTIGYSYICRSIGGSLSDVNVKLFTQYDTFRHELVTNLVYDLNARYMAFGSKCVYMLAAPRDGSLLEIPKRVVRGIKLELEAIDVTPNS